MTFRVELVVEPEPSEIDAVVDELVRFNTDHAGPARWTRLAATARDDDGTLVGGAVGETHWNWLYVSHLWVDERARGEGLGTRLLGTVAATAVERGCDAVHLDTYDFQAPSFYAGLGFREFGVLADYPTGRTRHFLWRPLPLA